MTRVRSVSGVGLSIVYVEFSWQTDIYLARQQVAERLQLVRDQMPANVHAQMGPISSVMGEIMLIAMSSTTENAMKLREIADFVVRRQLLTVPGVSQVVPIGGEVRQYRIVPDTRRMASLDVDFDGIEKSLKSFGANTGGGFVDQQAREFLIRNIGRTTKIEHLQNLVVAYRKGQPVVLSQVAAVDFAARTKRGDAGLNAKPAVILAVQKQPSGDTVTITKEIERMLPELQRVMPQGVRVTDIQFRQATFIETSISNVKKVLIEALVVVTLVLFAFLLNWQTTFISLMAIPLSVMMTVIVFQLFGLSINTMTLGGLAIAIGALVDDAVVGVENIYWRLKQHRAAAGHDHRGTLEVVAAATNEVRSGILYARPNRHPRRSHRRDHGRRRRARAPEDDDRDRDHGRPGADPVEPRHGLRSHAAHRRADDRRHGVLDRADARRHPRNLCGGERLAVARDGAEQRRSDWACAGAGAVTVASDPRRVIYIMQPMPVRS